MFIKYLVLYLQDKTLETSRSKYLGDILHKHFPSWTLGPELPRNNHDRHFVKTLSFKKILNERVRDYVT